MTSKSSEGWDMVVEQRSACVWTASVTLRSGVSFYDFGPTQLAAKRAVLRKARKALVCAGSGGFEIGKKEAPP